jgi:hypothetical protein
MTWTSGEQAAKLTGKTVSEIDQAAAQGVIPARYVGWRLLVDVEDKRETKQAPAKKTAARKAARK